MKAKQFLAICTIFAALAPNVWALVGGPWDHLNRSAFSPNNPDGLYQASITMKNGSGFLKFVQDSDLEILEAQDLSSLNQSSFDFFTGSVTSVQLSDGLAQNSNTIVYYQGKTFFGNTYGNVDAAGGHVSGTTSGTSAQVEDLTSSLQDFADQQEAILNFPEVTDSFNMSFEGKITARRPQIRFEAKGEIEFFARPPVSTEISVGDISDLVIVASGTGTTQLDLSDIITKVVTTDGDYSSQGKVDLRVFGRRSSVTPDSGNPLDLSVSG